ncbi:ABC-2 transporter permease [Alkaliphilus transvaalensis]|uniref:ABC-2 transporter permease n=1 Tax=Alkaliphilus transvaalensis TaxID=114628 RepID=UPI00047AD1E8|nr:ABC-2 transporter permease [Alkaliphilus transvaalensis]
MISLILKDAIIQKKSYLFTALYGIFIFIAFGMGGGSLASGAYIMGILASSYNFIQGGCAADDKNNTEVIFNSLPITRKTIVSAKYVSSILFSMINCLIIILIGYLFSKLQIGNINIITQQEIYIALISVSLFIAFYLPIYYKFGYIKARAYNTFVFLGFFFGPTILITKLSESKGHSVINTLINMNQSNDNGLFYGLLMFIAIVLLVASMGLSSRIYRKRDF